MDWAVELLLDAQSRGFVRLLKKRLENDPRYLFFHKSSLGIEISSWLSQLGFKWSNEDQEIDISIEALLIVLSRLLREEDRSARAPHSANECAMA